MPDITNVLLNVYIYIYTHLNLNMYMHLTRELNLKPGLDLNLNLKLRLKLEQTLLAFAFTIIRHHLANTWRDVSFFVALRGVSDAGFIFCCPARCFHMLPSFPSPCAVFSSARTQATIT